LVSLLYSIQALTLSCKILTKKHTKKTYKKNIQKKNKYIENIQKKAYIKNIQKKCTQKNIHKKHTKEPPNFFTSVALCLWEAYTLVDCASKLLFC
jgi:hypothetical protein